MKSKIKLFDYHTQALAHGENKPILIDDTVRAAVEKGLNSICFTDHFPLPKDYFDPTNDIRVSYPEYVEKVLSAKKRFGNRIEVCLGAEFDWIPGYQKWIKKQIDSYPFDFVIGSVHEVYKESGESIPIDFTREFFDKAVETFATVKNLIITYYKLVKQATVSGLFDCIGHIDRIKVFNDGSLFDEKSQWYEELVLEILDSISSSKLATEVNTSGYDRTCASSYPSVWILQEAFKRNIPLTLGSDAHQPEQIGRYFDQTIELIKKTGYTELVRFINRQKVRIPIM